LEPRLTPADVQGPLHEALLRLTPVATVTLDRDATVTSWNPAAEELFGYSCEEAVGRRLDELVAAAPEGHASGRRRTTLRSHRRAAGAAQKRWPKTTGPASRTTLSFEAV
jgi:PAS domain S-box-containing protein